MVRSLFRPVLLFAAVSASFNLMIAPRDLNRAELELLHSAAARHTDGESLLARGNKIPLSRCGVYEFELIPKVSDTLAFRLMTHKRAIMARARRLPGPEAYQALELVKGIGPKTAKMLASKIDLRK